MGNELTKRTVLKVYSLQRQFSGDESALLATLRGMSDTERELLVESLQPEKPIVKKRAVNSRAVEHCVADVKGNPCQEAAEGTKMRGLLRG